MAVLIGVPTFGHHFIWNQFRQLAFIPTVVPCESTTFFDLQVTMPNQYYLLIYMLVHLKVANCWEPTMEFAALTAESLQIRDPSRRDTLRQPAKLRLIDRARVVTTDPTNHGLGTFCILVQCAKESEREGILRPNLVMGPLVGWRIEGQRSVEVARDQI